MELKDVLGEIESDGANLVHGRLLEWALTPPLWHAEAVGGRPHHQGFGTRCLRFARDVAAARARLASGWLVSLCRERVELSGSRRKVSERSHVILLSRAYPVASWVHAYNAQGPDALGFRRTGGRPPLRSDCGGASRRRLRRPAYGRHPTPRRSRPGTTVDPQAADAVCA